MQMLISLNFPKQTRNIQMMFYYACKFDFVFGLTRIYVFLYSGFIGKGMTRQMNKTWNYIGKGVLGTLGIVFIFPTLCLLTTILSLAIACTAFLW